MKPQPFKLRTIPDVNLVTHIVSQELGVNIGEPLMPYILGDQTTYHRVTGNDLFFSLIGGLRNHNLPGIKDLCHNKWGITNAPLNCVI